MIGTYQPHLDRLDSTWSAWLAAGDIDALRRRAYAALAFALCSVHTPVAEGEREFIAFMVPEFRNGGHDAYFDEPFVGIAA